MKRVQICGFALVTIALLVLLALSDSAYSASNTPPNTIPSSGYVQYAVGPPAKNWARLPEDWRIDDGDWNAPTYLDYNVLHNGHPSIRMEKGTDASKSREILVADKTQSDWSIHVKPGDHIVFKVWMKTSASTIGDTAPCSGIRLGIDFYASGRITGIQSPDGSYWTTSGGFPLNEYLNYVNWGQDWTQRTMDFVIPNQYPSDGGGGSYSPGTLVTPDRMIPWMQVWSGSYGNADNGIAWFADSELYINP